MIIQPCHYIVAADIKGFFDHVRHEWMMKFLRHRIADQVNQVVLVSQQNRDTMLMMAAGLDADINLGWTLH